MLPFLPLQDSILAIVGGGRLLPNPKGFLPDLLLGFGRVEQLASLFGFDDFEPFALDFRAGRRAADHAEAVVDEPDHVVQVALAVLRVL